MEERATISKTRRKKEMLARQELGARLAELNAGQLALLGLPEALHEAILAFRQMSRFEARRRQMQFIGKLMRDVDPAPIQAQLDAWRASLVRQAAWLQEVERWRERLLTEEQALAELLRAYPGADARQLQALIRGALNERVAGKSPRSYRALFRSLREILSAEREEKLSGE